MPDSITYRALYEGRPGVVRFVPVAADDVDIEMFGDEYADQVVAWWSGDDASSFGPREIRLTTGRLTVGDGVAEVTTVGGRVLSFLIEKPGIFREDGHGESVAYITGDLHGGAEHDMRLAARRWPEGKALTRDDYVIVCGDFGYVWDGGATDEYWLDWFAEKPWTTLFVDGNHENHAMLAALPVERWHGGLTHIVRPNVRHLMRGQVFEDVAGSRILAMGGAASHDVEWREEGVSWWREEMPSEAERCECRVNLDACGWSVDYVVTHEAPSRLAEWLSGERGRDYDLVDGGDEQQRFLGELRRRLSFKRWYFGHYHDDQDIPDERGDFTLLYRRIVPLGKGVGG